ELTVDDTDVGAVPFVCSPTGSVQSRPTTQFCADGSVSWLHGRQLSLPSSHTVVLPQGFPVCRLQVLLPQVSDPLQNRSSLHGLLFGVCTQAPLPLQWSSVQTFASLEHAAMDGLNWSAGHAFAVPGQVS